MDKLKRLSGSRKKSSSGSNARPGVEKEVYRFSANEPGWISSKSDAVWKRCTVLSQSGILLTVKVQGKAQSELVDLRFRSVFPMNDGKTESDDMTSLRHLNEPCILEYLEKRAYSESFGTFIGPVLVSVNPMKPTQEPRNVGAPDVESSPTPYAIAEFALKQLCFAGDNRRKKAVMDYVNQTVIASGESGAGKTESSKKVLKHLVMRAGGKEDVDKRLIKSSSILEAFGNASTLRNDNSSRFGKLLKLNFIQTNTEVGTPAKFSISGASVVTYLLERSRISNRPIGEKNFKIFYYLLAGVDDAVRQALFLDKLKRKGFRYLVPLKSTTQRTVSREEMHGEMASSDQEQFVDLEQALLDSGFHIQECLEIFKLVAAVMHLGNIAFGDKTTSEGDIAMPSEVEKGYDPIECSAALLGVKPEELERLLLERKVETRGESIIVHRTSSAACFARDAVAKTIYVKLWDHLNDRINQELGSQGPSSSPFIGVLDIFGFESFARNDFEQLLINYTNESLQSVFNRKVFQAELALYKSEGLAVDEACIQIPSNEPAMELLAGKLKGSSPHDREFKDSILVDLDQHSRELKPSDEKLLHLYQQKFGKHPNFVEPHPKFRHEAFIVLHYAGEVKYTIGNFIEKNNDQLPKAFNALFSKCANRVLKSRFKQRKSSNMGRKKPAKQTIVKTFRAQIQDLLNTLEQTACSFIRCVKPSPNKSRIGSSWFDRRYVSHQLKHLSIPQTAQVLRGGLPTRVPFDDLVETYSKALPKEARGILFRGNAGGKGSGNMNKLFVSALFWAFRIDPAKYKIGHTKVFFRAGDIAILDNMLHKAALWQQNTKDQKLLKEKTKVTKRFRYYFSRLFWRRAFIKVKCQNRFLRSLETRRKNAAKIQSIVRTYLAVNKLRKKLHEAEIRRQKKKEEEEQRRKEAERKRVLEELQKKKQKKLEKQVALRKKSTLERKEARAKQVTLEREQSIARQKTTLSRGKKPLDPEITGLHLEDSEDSDKETITTEESETESSGSDAEEDFEAGDATHLPRMKEKKRMQKYASEIEKKAKQKAVKEATIRRESGKKVTKEEEEQLKQQFEKQLTEEAAEFEALRQHDEDLRDGYFKKMVRKNSRKKSQSADSSLDPALQVGRRLSSTLKKHTEFKENTKLMKKSSYVQERLQETQEKLDEHEHAEAQNTLRRNRTVTGEPTYKVNETEIETPVKSAAQMKQVLKDMVERGELTVAEVMRLNNDLMRTLEKKTTVMHSEKSDKGVESLPVMCANCRTENNTYYGIACSSCNAPLPVDIFDQTEKFRKPDEEEWASEAALQFRGGKVFLRIVDQKNRYMDNFEEHMLFSIECAWQKRPVSKVHTRWIITANVEDLETLHDKLKKEGTRSFKHPKQLPHEFPVMNREVQRKEKQKGRYSIIKDAFSRISLMLSGPDPAEEPIKEDVKQQKPLTPEQFVVEVQKWLGHVIDAGSEGNAFRTKPQGTNPIFKGAFGTFVQVTEHVNALIKARGR